MNSTRKPRLMLHLAWSSDPRHPEDDLAFRLAQPFDQPGLGIMRPLGEDAPEAVEHLAHGLVKFGFARIPVQDVRIDRAEDVVSRSRGHL